MSKFQKTMLGATFALALGGASALTSPAFAVGTTASTDATAMANALAGTGFTIISATLTSNTENGFFTGGSAATGIGSGIVLTTGQLGCIGSSNSTSSCTGSGSSAELSIDFSLSSSSLFFNYAFGSEEYNEYVSSQFNDSFELLLDGVNIATLPGSSTFVTINNVNNGLNSAYYFDNTSGLRPMELDGITTVLTASATGLSAGTHNLKFIVKDIGDSNLDSAVFIQGGSIGVVNPPNPSGGIPEPSTWAMMIIGFGAVGSMVRNNRRRTTMTFA